jgi:hypothetical protein
MTFVLVLEHDASHEIVGHRLAPALPTQFRLDGQVDELVDDALLTSEEHPGVTGGELEERAALGTDVVHERLEQPDAGRLDPSRVAIVGGGGRLASQRQEVLVAENPIDIVFHGWRLLRVADDPVLDQIRSVSR